MARLDALIVGRQRHEVAVARRAALQERDAFRFGVLEVLEQDVDVGVLEVEAGIFLLRLLEHVAVGDARLAVAAVEVDVVDAIDALHIHRQPLEAISQLAGNGGAFESRDLLKVGELRHFHPVAPAFPPQAPCAKGRALPVVLDEAHVVEGHIDADRGERIEIKLLKVLRRGLQDHLILVIVLEPVGVLAVASVLRPAGGLDVSRLPGPGSERAQRRRRMERAGADLHVIGLQHDAALPRPEGLQGQNEALKRPRRVERDVWGGRHGVSVMDHGAATLLDAGADGQRERRAPLAPENLPRLPTAARANRSKSGRPCPCVRPNAPPTKCAP